MLKIIEIRETLEDTELIGNIYAINKITKELIDKTKFITELSKLDFDYINIVLANAKNNLEKVKKIITI